MHKMENKLKKIQVGQIIIWSIITLGIYPIFWANKRKTELENLETEEIIKKEIIYGYSLTWIIGLIIYALLLLGKYPEYTNTLKIAGLIAIILSWALLIMVCFEYKKILNTKLRHEGNTLKLSEFFTFIFNIFYLQYEINRMTKRREYEKRKGPLACAIVLFGIVLPLVIEVTLIEVFTDIKLL